MADNKTPPCTSSSASQPERPAPETPKRKTENNYSVHEVLYAAAAATRAGVPSLHISLPIPLPKLPDIMSAIVPALSDNATASDLGVQVLPTRSDKSRAQLRAAALEMNDFMRRGWFPWGCAPQTSAPQDARPIFTPQSLEAADVPVPLTPEQRQRIRDKLAGAFSGIEMREPYHMLPVALTDRSLPTVKANLTVALVDEEDETRHQIIPEKDCLWDTGAHFTVISDDCLSNSFLKLMREDPGNEPYRNMHAVAGGQVMQVQVSALVNMSNGKVQLDTVAMVLPRAAIPNQRSGIILGQRMAIDRVVYVSTPRSVMAAEGRDPGEEYWGVFDAVKYLDADQALVHV